MEGLSAEGGSWRLPGPGGRAAHLGVHGPPPEAGPETDHAPDHSPGHVDEGQKEESPDGDGDPPKHESHGHGGGSLVQVLLAVKLNARDGIGVGSEHLIA